MASARDAAGAAAAALDHTTSIVAQVQPFNHLFYLSAADPKSQEAKSQEKKSQEKKSGRPRLPFQMVVGTADARCIHVTYARCHAGCLDANALILHVF
jgi:hypothetical protein